MSVKTGLSLAIMTSTLTFALTESIPSVTWNIISPTPEISGSVTPKSTIRPSISTVIKSIVSETVKVRTSPSSTSIIYSEKSSVKLLPSSKEKVLGSTTDGGSFVFATLSVNAC